MGSVNLDNTGSGSEITLSSDGTSLLLDGTAIGGGGGSPDLYADSANGSAVTPTANAGGSYNSVAIGNGADIGSGRGDSIAIGTDALANQSQALAIGRSATVNSSGTWGTAVGRNSVVNGQSAVALGNSYSAGTDSFAAVIDNNTSSYGATGTSSIAMSYLAKATQSYAFAQGYQAQATGNSCVALGFQAQTSNGVALGYRGKADALRTFGVNNNGGGATGNFSTAIGDGCLSSGSVSVAIGIGAQATGTYSWATGARTNTNGLTGKHVWSGIALSGNNDGSTQTGTMVLAIATTDATATAITSNGLAASTTNQVGPPNNSAYAFHGIIVARQKASEGTASAAWKVEGLIRREGSAGTTVLVASTVTAISNAPSWGMALTADTTYGCLKVEATGAASTNIRWVGTIETSELIYA